MFMINLLLPKLPVHMYFIISNSTKVLLFDGLTVKNWITFEFNVICVKLLSCLLFLSFNNLIATYDVVDWMTSYKRAFRSLQNDNDNANIYKNLFHSLIHLLKNVPLTEEIYNFFYFTGRILYKNSLFWLVKCRTLGGSKTDFKDNIYTEIIPLHVR